MTQKCFSLVTGALMAAVLLMAGCSNPLDQQEQNGSVSGRGTVRLSLAGAKGRTLFPDVTGLLYRVEAARIGESLQLIIDEWPGSGTQTLTLAPGTWTITVTGYATEDGIDVSRGTVNDVIIIEDTTAPSLSILLNRLGIPDSGTGTLRYGGLEFNNLIPFPLAIGTLTLERVDGTVGETRNLLASDYDTMSAITDLPSGYYILTVELEKTNKKYAIKSELIHIYKDRTTKITDSQVMRFDDNDFALRLGSSPLPPWTGIPPGTVDNISSTFSSQVNNVVYGGSPGSEKFVAVGHEGKMAYSANGTSWTGIDLSSIFVPGENPSRIQCVAYGNGIFLAGGDDGKMASSTDGISWTEIDLSSIFGSTQSRICGVVYGGGKWVAVGRKAKMAYSLDGITWTGIDLSSIVETLRFDPVGPNAFIQGVAYGAGKWVAVGRAGKMAYSLDGITWTGIDASAIFGTSEIWAVVYAAGKFVAVGSGGKMAYSTGGISWTGIPPGPVDNTSSTFDDSNIFGVGYGDGKFIAVGAMGKMAYSTNGITWTGINGTDSTFGTTSEIYGAAYGAGRFVAVGGAGKIAYSNY